jgi:signal transduction histidine kinase
LQINQLFLNLLSNSLKFSEGAPDINISSSILPESEIKKIGFTKNGAEYIKLVFSDNGIGFEQQYADKIFSIFQRLHTSQYAGTGIGLALCKKIVENHGGFITVESEPEKGTSFFIYLPLMHNSNNEQTNSQDQKGIFHSVNQ